VVEVVVVDLVDVAEVKQKILLPNNMLKAEVVVVDLVDVAEGNQKILLLSNRLKADVAVELQLQKDKAAAKDKFLEPKQSI
jgi:hypothetical protein